jgi:hypothetical protein
MTRHGTHGAALIGAACALLGGCASEPEGPFAFGDGWRRGEVVSVMRTDEVPNPRFWTCLRKGELAGVSADLVVVVSYRQSSRRRRHLTQLPPGVAALRPGEKVFVNVEQCRDGLARREG